RRVRSVVGGNVVAEQRRLLFGHGTAHELLGGDAQEADATLHVDVRQQLARDTADVGGQIGRLGQGPRPRDGREVAEADLQLDGPGGDVGGAQTRRDPV